MLNLKYIFFLSKCLVNLSVTISFGIFTNVAGKTTENSYDSRMLFYNGASTANYISHNLTTAENIVDDPTFNRTKLIAIFTHGWMQTPTDQPIQTLISSYISNGNYNFLLLDWSQAASMDILLVQSKIPGLGMALGSFLNKIFKKGIKITSVHLVGHSFGAYVSSGAGVYAQETKPNILPRITGLDPGNFYKPLLQKTDATFVDIIHTNPGFAGTPINSATVDFYPNMNSILVQPGCPLIAFSMKLLACSHNRGIELFSESVRNNNNRNFLSTNVNHPLAPKIQMGNNCPTTAVGIYKLLTVKARIRKHKVDFDSSN